MKSKILKLFAVLAMCFMVVGALVACGQDATGAQGAKGDKGDAGKGIVSIDLSADGTKLVVKYTDNSTAEVKLPVAESTACKEHDYVNHDFYGDKHTATLQDDGTWAFEEAKCLRVCKVCGASKIAIGVFHNLIVGDIAATCTDDAYTGEKCADCDYSVKTSIKENTKTGHTYVDFKDVEEENRNVCEVGRWTIGTCKDCGAKGPKFMPAEGHKVSLDAWSKSAGSAELFGYCVNENCSQKVTVKLPAFDETNYAYNVADGEEATCTVGGKATWTLNEAAFLAAVKEYTAKDDTVEYDATKYVYNVTIEATGHFVLDNGTKIPVKYVPKDGDAYIYGHGVEVLDYAGKLVCGAVKNGFYICTECHINVATEADGSPVKVIGEHDFNEETTPATCLSPELKTCKLCDETVEIGEALAHTYKYALAHLDTGAYVFTSECTTCKTQNSSVTVTDDVYRDADASELATCIKVGKDVMVYEFTNHAGKTDKVSCNVELPKSTTHEIVLVDKDGKEFKATEIAPGQYAFDSSRIGDEYILDRNTLDLETCMLVHKAKAFYPCACRTNVTVDIYNPHSNAVLDPDHPETVKVTCKNNGLDIYVCEKCGDVAKKETVTRLDHEMDYNLEKVSGTEYKLNVSCKNCDTPFDSIDGLILGETVFISNEIGCTTRIETITVKKDLDGNGDVDEKVFTNTYFEGAHSVADGVLITTLDKAPGSTEVAPIYFYNAGYFKPLNVHENFVCGVDGIIDGYYVCTECNMNVSVKLQADHLWSNDPNDLVVIKPASCDEKGEVKQVCTKCGVKSDVIYTTEDGHTDLTAVVTTAPTLTTTGVLTITCGVADCGKSYEIVLPAISNPEDGFVYELIEKPEIGCDETGVYKYAGTFVVVANGFFPAATFEDVKFSFQSQSDDHTGYSEDACFSYTEEEMVNGVLCNVTYTVWQCTVCGHYIVVDRVEEPVVPVIPAT